MQTVQMQRSIKGALLARRTPCSAVRPLLPKGMFVRAQAASSAVTETYTNGNGNGNGATAAAPAPVAAAPAAAAPAPPLLSPPDAYMAVAVAGKKCANMTPAKLFTMGIYAGVYIAFGGFLSTAVVNGCPGIYSANPGLAKLLFALVFPVGLTLNTLHGTELFTGNTMKLPAAIIEGKATWGGLMKNWFWSYIGNFVGSLAMVALVVASGVLAGAWLPAKTAMLKSSLPWMQCFLRAVMANWLVCCAVWNAGAANSLPGKVLGIWPPIAAFVAIGLEHSVANMFLIPLGICLGADISFSHFLTANLIPVTLGNIVGGFVFMGLASGYFFGSLGKSKEAEPAPAH